MNAVVRRGLLAAAVAALAFAAPWPALADPDLRARDLGGARPQVAAVALAAAEGGSLPLALALFPVVETAADSPGSTAAPRTSALLVAEIGGDALLAGTSAGVAVELTTYALDGDGVAGFLAEGVRVEAREALVGGALRYVAALPLPPGEHVLRLLVRQRETGVFGLRSARIVIPAAGAPAAALALPATAAAGVEVWSPRLPARPDGALGRILDLRPAAMPVISARGGGTVAVPGGAGGALAVEARRPGDGSVVATSVVVASPSPGPVPSFAVPTGVYELLPQGPNATPIRALIWAEDTARPERWTEVLRGSGRLPPAAVAPAVNEAAPRDAGAERTIAAAYREALGRFAAGERDAAVARLHAAQLAALAASARATTDIARAENDVDEALAKVDREALLPAADLRFELFRVYLGEQRPGHAALALRSALAALQRYAGAARGDAAGTDLAVAAILRLAGGLLDESGGMRAAEVAAEVEKFAPGHPTALLVEAYVYERHGDRARADAALDRLLAIHPEVREARLRKAVLARQAGSPRTAERLLRALLDEGVRDWVDVVAAQELARSLVLRGEASAGAQIAARAAARAPEDAALPIVRAWAEERAGVSRGPGLEALFSMRTSNSSARHRYGRPPDDLAVARREAEEATLLRSAALTAALARTAGGKP